MTSPFPDSATSFPDVNEYTPDHRSLLLRIIRVIRNLNKGRSNNAYSVTLTANAGTTTVNLSNGDIGENSLVFFTPQTANAALEIGAGTMYVSSRNVTSNAFTITHANNAQTDRTFGFIIVG